MCHVRAQLFFLFGLYFFPCWEWVGGWGKILKLTFFKYFSIGRRKEIRITFFGEWPTCCPIPWYREESWKYGVHVQESRTVKMLLMTKDLYAKSVKFARVTLVVWQLSWIDSAFASYHTQCCLCSLLFFFPHFHCIVRHRLFVGRETGVTNWVDNQLVFLKVH